MGDKAPALLAGSFQRPSSGSPCPPRTMTGPSASSSYRNRCPGSGYQFSEPAAYALEACCAAFASCVRLADNSAASAACLG